MSLGHRNLVCPHCGHERPSEHHYRDPGSLTVPEATAAGYCPVLTAKRAANSTRFHPADERLTLREDRAIAETDPRADEIEWAEALARATSAEW